MLTQYLEKSEYESINQDGTEIIKLLTKIIITTRKNL
jgi:hypothetical protein